jgi:hypothetical protein
VTAHSPGPHWGNRERWTEFFIAIVPTVGQTGAARELYRRVRQAIEEDVILFDLVTVAVCPTADGSFDQDDAIVAALLTAATDRGHFLAPRVVFGCVVVGTDVEAVDAVRAGLARQTVFRQLCVQFGPPALVGDTTPDPSAVLSFASDLMFGYERDPGISCGEAEFLDLARLLGGPVFATPVRQRAASRATPAGPGVPLPSPPAVAHRDVALPSPRPGLVRRLQESLGTAERGLTDAESFDELALRGDGVALVSLVFLPDDDQQSWALARRRRAAAIRLDAALAAVNQDPRGGASIQVAVEVLGPGDPFVRHRGVRSAGRLSEPDLPRITIDTFDLPDAFEVLLRQLERNASSIRTRGVNVVSSHVIVLATIAPLPTRESVARFDELLTQARITWIHFGPEEEMIPVEFERRGAILLTDEPDLVNTVLYYSSDIYARALPTVPDLTMADLTVPDLTVPDLTVADLTVPDLAGGVAGWDGAPAPGLPGSGVRDG